ncbi:MAG TPA: c-type cytochrome [Terriglobales bacterium]|nr:c-type cytochrome [Terriglobales bacterium]
MTLKKLSLFLLAVFAALTWLTLPSPAQTRSDSPRLVPLDGAQIYLNHCAACHGNDARGHGPATVSLKHKVPDLTSIAQRNGGTFPYNRVKAVIAGTDEPPTAHGSREMPIWGPVFHDFEWDQDLGEVRLQNITDYVESLQRK